MSPTQNRKPAVVGCLVLIILSLSPSSLVLEVEPGAVVVGAVGSNVSSGTRPARSVRGQEARLLLQRVIELQSQNNEPLAGIDEMVVTKRGQLVLFDDHGTKLSIFDSSGAFLRAHHLEDFYGPGKSKVTVLERLVTVGENSVLLLASGFVSHLVLYDIDAGEFETLRFRDESQDARVHALTDIAATGISDPIVLLEHPRLAFAQVGVPRITVLRQGGRRVSFAAFPDLAFPVLSQHFASWGDRLRLLANGTLWAVTPLSDRIYRYDMNGRRLPDFVYPAGFLRLPDEDAPANNPRKWSEHIAAAAKGDRLKEVFPIRQDSTWFCLVVRIRETSIHFDLFREDGRFFALGEYDALLGGDSVIAISNLNDLLYVLRWPEVSQEEFETLGNPYVSVYRVELPPR